MTSLLFFRRTFLVLSLSILAGAMDLAFAGPPEGIFWRMSKDDMKATKAYSIIKASYADVFKISAKELSVDNTLADFEKTLKEIVQNNQEIHVYLSSHGCVGAICHGESTIKYDDILSSIQKVINDNVASEEGRHKIKVNIVCDACHSGSLIDRALLSKNISFELNVLSSAKTDDLSYRGYLPDQLVNGKIFLSKMPDNLKKQFCPGCSDFQRMGKLINLLELSNVTYPQIFSGQRTDLTKVTFDELNALMQSSFLMNENHLVIKIMDIIYSRWSNSSNTEKELILNSLKGLMSNESNDKKIMSQYFYALYSKNPKDLISTYLNPDFKEVFKPHYYQDGVFLDAEIFKINNQKHGAKNKINFETDQEAIKKRADEIDRIVRDRPDLLREMQFSDDAYEKIVNEPNLRFVNEYSDKFPPGFYELLLKKMKFEMRASPSFYLNLSALNNLVLLQDASKSSSASSEFVVQVNDLKKEIMARMLSRDSYENISLVNVKNFLANKRSQKVLGIIALLDELEHLEIDKDYLDRLEWKEGRPKKDDIDLVKKAVTRFKEQVYKYVIYDYQYYYAIVPDLIFDSVRKRNPPVPSNDEVRILARSHGSWKDHDEYAKILLKNPNVRFWKTMRYHDVKEENIQLSIDNFLKNKDELSNLKMTHLEAVYNHLTLPHENDEYESVSEELAKKYNERISKITKDLENNVYPEFTKIIMEKAQDPGSLTEKERAFAQKYLSKMNKASLEKGRFPQFGDFCQSLFKSL